MSGCQTQEGHVFLARIDVCILSCTCWKSGSDGSQIRLECKVKNGSDDSYIMLECTVKNGSVVFQIMFECKVKKMSGSVDLQITLEYTRQRISGYVLSPEYPW